MEPDVEYVKIADLTPEAKKVNLLVKVIGVEEPRDIETRYGSKHLAEATIADDSGSLIMTLWEEQVGTVEKGDVLQIENAYISLVRGTMRLNLGRYGKINKLDEELEDVSTEPNMSFKVYEGRSRPPRSGGSRGGSRGGSHTRGGERGSRGGRFGKWV